MRASPPPPIVGKALARLAKPCNGRVPSILRRLDLRIRIHDVHAAKQLDGLEEVPRLARDYGIKVTAGAWIGTDEEKNKAEIASLIRMARAHRNVDRLIVGNEAILRGDVTVDELIQQLRRVRKAVKRRREPSM